MGNISNDGIVTCPFHGARFNATTGKKVKEPVLAPSQQMEPLPKTWQHYLEHAEMPLKVLGMFPYEVFRGGSAYDYEKSIPLKGMV
jgi:nitrite reductase/ring-hydroxylating ferredoxin subunit